MADTTTREGKTIMESSEPKCSFSITPTPSSHQVQSPSPSQQLSWPHCALPCQLSSVVLQASVSWVPCLQLVHLICYTTHAQSRLADTHCWSSVFSKNLLSSPVATAGLKGGGDNLPWEACHHPRKGWAVLLTTHVATVYWGVVLSTKSLTCRKVREDREPQVLQVEVQTSWPSHNLALNFLSSFSVE
jgi:hypothetical protein